MFTRIPRVGEVVLKRTLLLAVLATVLTAAPVASQSAEDLYQSACDDGELEACTVLGLMFESGTRVPRNLVRAVDLYETACQGGEPGACVNLGSLYEAGDPVPRDVARAADLYRRGCNGGQLLGCDDLGGVLERGDGVPRDFSAAVALYERACDGGMMLACTHLGMMSQRGAGVPQSVVRATALYGRACGGGDALGCVYIGVSYERGEGVAPDAARAADFYRQACDGGAMLGCANLGSAYRTGSGVDLDMEMATELYGRACLGGIMLGCMNLGVMYETGDGVEQDVRQAATLYARACDLGAPAACQRIGAPPPVLAPTRASAPSPDSTSPPGVPLYNKVGRIADSQSEVSLADALVDFPTLRLRLVTDETGRVDLRDVPEGSYPIRVQHMGYDDISGTVQVPGTAEFLVLLNRSLIENLDVPGRVLGRVTEEDGSQGVSDVDITVMTSTPQHAISDGQGRFTLRDLEPGLVDVRFERLGYEPRTSAVVIQPGRTVEIAATISTRPIPLDPIEVVAVRSRYLEQTGFYERRDGGWGNQISRQDFEDINPISTTDVFYTVPGVSVSSAGEVISLRTTGFGQTGCVLQTYLDGVAVDDFDLNILPPEQIEAVEVYQGLAVPIQYPQGGCGIVLVWTRRG